MSNESGGIGFLGTLTIVFIVLKLVGVIDWSWWWVLSPIILSFAFFLFGLFVVGVLLLVGKIMGVFK